VFSFLESTKSVVERYQKIRLGVPDGRRVLAVPLQCFADRPQYSFPNLPCQSLSFPKGSFPFDLASDYGGNTTPDHAGSSYDLSRQGIAIFPCLLLKLAD